MCWNVILFAVIGYVIGILIVAGVIFYLVTGDFPL